MSKLAIVIKWREDVDKGELVEVRRKNKSYCSFAYIGDKEGRAIQAGANAYWEVMESNLRVHFSAGEFLPGTAQPH